MAERNAFPLRLRADVYDGVRRWADEDLRSVNGQIEFLLRQALIRSGRLRAAVGAEPAADGTEESGSTPGIGEE